MRTNSKFLRGILTVVISGAGVFTNPGNAQSITATTLHRLVLPAGANVIPFYWQGDTVHSEWEPHAALLVPVDIAGCPRRFYMQFDLGSPHSLFYKNKLTAIQQKYPATFPGNILADTLKNFSFTAGKTPVFTKEIPLKQFDSSTVDWQEQGMEIIGTIGADLIDGRVTVIDYPQGKLTISEAVPAELTPGIVLTDFVYARSSVLLPAMILGRRVLLYFDTGSSMYELLTDKKTCELLATPGARLLQNKVRSWDRLLTANTLASNDSITIAGTKVPVRRSTYMEGMDSSQVDRMLKMGIGGMTGNKLFLGYKLVLDTKNGKFALIR